MKGVKERVKLFIIVVVCLSPLWVTMLWPPNLHGALMYFYVNPLSILALFLLLGCITIFIREAGSKRFYVLLLIFLGYLFFASVTPVFVYPVVANSVKLERIQVMPEMDLGTVRILPRGVADKYVRDSIQYPRFRERDTGIVFINGTQYWQFCLIPDGLWNAFMLKDKGVVNVNMNTTEKEIHVLERSLSIGLNMLLFDNIKYYLFTSGLPYWVDYRFNDIFYVSDGEHLYTVIPFVSYYYVSWGPWIQGFPRPAGVVMIDEEGNHKVLGFEEALKNPLLRDNALFPEEDSRFYIEVLNWKNGFWNWFLEHREMFEIADPSEENKMPYMVKTEKGTLWFFAVKPYAGQGIYKIFLIDTRNPEIKVYYMEFPKQSALLSPHRGMEYVKKALPRLDWSTMKCSEPLPIIRGNKLFWNIRVVPRDYSGVSLIALVNAGTSDVKIFESVEDFIGVLVGKPPTKKPIFEQWVNGTMMDLKTFVVNGNSRFVLTLKLENRTLANFIARAEELPESTTIRMLTTPLGTRVSLRVSDGAVVKFKR